MICDTRSLTNSQTGIVNVSDLLNWPSDRTPDSSGFPYLWRPGRSSLRVKSSLISSWVVGATIRYDSVRVLNKFDTHKDTNGNLLFILAHTSLTQGVQFILQRRPHLFYTLTPLVNPGLPRVCPLLQAVAARPSVSLSCAEHSAQRKDWCTLKISLPR